MASSVHRLNRDSILFLERFLEELASEDALSDMLCHHGLSAAGRLLTDVS